MNFASLSSLALLRTRPSSFGAGLPRLCVRSAFRSVAFSLASPLPSTASAAARAALFGSFAGTMGSSDLLTSFIAGFWLPAFPARPAVPSSMGDMRISRFSRMKVPHVQRASDRAGPARTSQ